MRSEAERAPGLDRDRVSLGERPRVVSRHQRVELDLVDVGHDAGLRDQALEVRFLEVRGADRADAAVLEQLDQPPPGVDVAILPRHRPVDQEQVDVVDAEPFDAPLERPLGFVEAVRLLVELGREEQLLAGHAGGVQAATDALLVAVGEGGVDHAVAGGDRGRHGELRLGARQRPRAEAHRGLCAPCRSSRVGTVMRPPRCGT